jgi:hypothetical protein
MKIAAGEKRRREGELLETPRQLDEGVDVTLCGPAHQRFQIHCSSLPR